MKDRQQSTTSYPMCFLMVSSTNHVSPVTGLTPTVTISKNGAAFGSPSGAVSEIGSGWYALAGNATDRNTLGDLLIHATGTGADPVDDRYSIVAYDPYDSVRMGLSALPNAAADAPGGLPISDAGGLDLDAILGRITDARMAVLTDWINGGRLDVILDAIATDVAGLDGAAMRGTDGAALASAWTATRAGYIDLLNTYLDAAISGRSTLTAQQVWEYATRTLSAFGFNVTVGTNNDKTGYSLSATPPTAAAIADAVWDEAISGHADSGTTGAALSAAGSSGDPWETSLPGSYGSGTAGNIIGNRIDAAITSRSSHSAADVWAVTTRTLSSFGTLVSDITTAVWSAGTRTLSGFGSLVADVWNYATRALTDKAGFTISGTKQTLDALNDVSSSTVRTQADAALTAYDAPTKAELDAAVAPLATSAALSAVDDYIDTEIAAIKAVTDKLDTAMESDGGVYRFTANALEEGPSGTSGGGDATAANQATIIAHLTDIKGAGFSGTTDSLESIRDRGDAAWITGSGLSGSNAAVITIQDEDDANIVEASVEIWDSAGTTFYERKTTNSSGQASFNMDDGTYTVKIHKAGYSKADQTLVIPDTLNPVYAMTAYSIPAPADSTLCRLYAYMKNADGTIPTTVTASLTITSLPEEESNTFYSGAALTGVYSNTTGLLYFDVIQGAAVRLKIGAWGVDETFTVPALATDDIGGLI